MKNKIIILSLFAALFFSFGCSPRIIVHESVRDSLITRTKLDSIYIYERDSFYVEKKGDTVFFNKYSIKYRDKIVKVNDTTFINKVEVKEVAVPAKLNWWQRTQINLFWWLFSVIAIIIVWQIIKIYFKLKK